MDQQLEKREPNIMSRFAGPQKKFYIPGTAQGPAQLQ